MWIEYAWRNLCSRFCSNISVTSSSGPLRSVRRASSSSSKKASLRLFGSCQQISFRRSTQARKSDVGTIGRPWSQGLKAANKPVRLWQVWHCSRYFVGCRVAKGSIECFDRDTYTYALPTWSRNRVPSMCSSVVIARLYFMKAQRRKQREVSCYSSRAGRRY